MIVLLAMMVIIACFDAKSSAYRRLVIPSFSRMTPQIDIPGTMTTVSHCHSHSRCLEGWLLPVLSFRERA